MLSLVALGVLGLGAALVWQADRPPSSTPRTVCRPSAPAAALAASGRPAVLFHGNSLVHDHGWRLEDVLVVNCARQGLTASTALEAVHSVPDVAPVLIVLGFGSVEATRAYRKGEPLDMPGFLDTAAELTKTLAARWPESPIIWLPVPQTTSNQLRPIEAARLNAGLSGLASTRPRILFAGDLDQGDAVLRPRLYDGLHLAPEAYVGWEILIAQTLAETR